MKNSRTWYAALFVALFHFDGFSGECSWKLLEARDTMNVYLAKSVIGDLIYSIDYDSSAKRVVVQINRSMGDSPGSMNRMYVRETRTYNILGSLVSAYQEIEGRSGINTWGVKKNPGGWEYIAIIGGKKNSRIINDIPDNLSSICRLRRGIADRTLKKGETWYDTAFELMSAQPMVTKIVCSDIDTVRRCWTFENVDNISGRTEKMVVNENGKALEQSIEGVYAARVRSAAAGGRTAPNGPQTAATDTVFRDITELFSVPADGPCPADRSLAVAVTDSSVSLDGSITHWYAKRGALWILRPLPSRCASRGRPSSDGAPAQWLRPTAVVQSDHPEINALAWQLCDKEVDPCIIIARLNHHVFTHVQKRNTAVFSNALETLHAGYGDCGEHAVLLTALLRAVGVPARVALGLIYVEAKKKYCYHAQVMAFSGEWLFADPTWDVFPASGRFAPLLIDDTGTDAMLLSRLIGRIRIEYVEN